VTRALEPAHCWNDSGVRGDRSCPKLKEVVHCHNCGVFAEATHRFFDRERTAGDEEDIEQTFAVETPQVTTRGGVRSVVVFQIGAELLALAANCLVEVTEARPVRSVAHRTNRLFCGIVNVHGQLELCVSLEGLLDLQRPADPEIDATRQRMVVFEGPDRQRWVFRVDRVIGVHMVAEQDFALPPATSNGKAQSYVTAVFDLEGSRVAYLEQGSMVAAFQRSVR